MPYQIKRLPLQAKGSKVTMMPEDEYEAFIASIDNRQAKRCKWGHKLSWHVARIAEENASDSQVEGDKRDFFVIALENARMVADDWKSYFPALIKGKHVWPDKN